MQLSEISRSPHNNGTEGCSKDIEQRENKAYGNGRESSTGNQYFKYVHTSTHHSIVSSDPFPATELEPNSYHTIIINETRYQIFDTCTDTRL